MNFIIILLLFTFISKSYNMKAELGGRVKIVCNVMKTFRKDQLLISPFVLGYLAN